MGRISWIRRLFVVAALYDGVLGLLFIFAPLAAFGWYNVPPPNHVGYVQFPAALLMVFAAMFARIAADPVGRRNLIPYGIGLKIAYCTTVFWHWGATGIPDMWKPFALADLLFMIFFFVAWRATRRSNFNMP